jgi:hypothetical protein
LGHVIRPVGTRIVVLNGSLLLGTGRSQRARPRNWQFQLAFGVLIGIAAGVSYAPIAVASA